jgi:HlyD family secretion protein
MSFLCTLPLISSLLTTCLPPLPLASGYVEGEYVLMAPVETAQIDQVTVRRGDRITAGQESATRKSVLHRHRPR